MNEVQGTLETKRYFEAEAKSLVTRCWVFISKMLQDSVSVERMMEIVRRCL